MSIGNRHKHTHMCARSFHSKAELPRLTDGRYLSGAQEKENQRRQQQPSSLVKCSVCTGRPATKSKQTEIGSEREREREREREKERPSKRRPPASTHTTEDTTTKGRGSGRGFSLSLSTRKTLPHCNSDVSLTLAERRKEGRKKLASRPAQAHIEQDCQESV